MSKTLKDIYSSYEGELSYNNFRSCCELFNQLAMDKIIDGYSLNMGAYLSSIYIVKVDRNYNNPQVNWGATNKYKKELLEEGYSEEDLYSKDNPDGIKYFIYHTDDWYCKFHWYKKGCKVRNKSAYRFTATRGDKGNKTKLKEKLNNNPLQHTKYKKG